MGTPSTTSLAMASVPARLFDTKLGQNPQPDSFSSPFREKTKTWLLYSITHVVIVCHARKYIAQWWLFLPINVDFFYMCECSIGVDVRDGTTLHLISIVAHVVMGCIVLGRQMKINIHSWLKACVCCESSWYKNGHPFQQKIWYLCIQKC